MAQERGELERIEPFNVVILPPQNIVDQAVRLSRYLNSEFNSRFILDEVNFLPHVTLYLTQYPAQSASGIEQIVEEIAKDEQPFTVRLEGFSALSGYIFWDAILDERLYNLHEKSLQTLSPLRAKTESYIELPGLSAGQRRGISEYGYALALEEYKPHITLTRLVYREEAYEVLERLPRITGEFTVDNITFAEAGPEGTVPSIIRRFSIQ